MVQRYSLDKKKREKTSLVEAVVHSDTGCHTIGCVCSGEGLQPRTQSVSSKGSSLKMSQRGRLPRVVQECTFSVVVLSLFIDWGCCRYEQGLGWDVRFQRGGPADDGSSVRDVLLLSVVAVLAC